MASTTRAIIARDGLMGLFRVCTHTQPFPCFPLHAMAQPLIKEGVPPPPPPPPPPPQGLPVVVAGVAPVHGISFSIYELCKQLSGANRCSPPPPPPPQRVFPCRPPTIRLLARRPGHHLLASSISGIVATLAHDACLAPIDTIKQRLQFSARPYRVLVLLH